MFDKFRAWVNASPGRQQMFRFVRLFLSALIPSLLAYSSSLEPVAQVPILAAAAGLLNTLWRQFEPLEGTSQLGRFIRTAIFTGVPQLLAVQFGEGSDLVVLASLLTAALEVAYRSTYGVGSGSGHRDTDS